MKTQRTTLTKLFEKNLILTKSEQRTRSFLHGIHVHVSDDGTTVEVTRTNGTGLLTLSMPRCDCAWPTSQNGLLTPESNYRAFNTEQIRDYPDWKKVLPDPTTMEKIVVSTYAGLLRELVNRFDFNTLEALKERVSIISDLDVNMLYFDTNRIYAIKEYGRATVQYVTMCNRRSLT